MATERRYSRVHLTLTVVHDVEDQAVDGVAFALAAAALERQGMDVWAGSHWSEPVGEG